MNHSSCAETTITEDATGWNGFRLLRQFQNVDPSNNQLFVSLFFSEDQFQVVGANVKRGSGDRAGQFSAGRRPEQRPVRA